MSDSHSISQRLYASLLLVYPAALRREFADEMVDVFSQQLHEAHQAQGWRGDFDVWGRVACETAHTLATSYMRAIGVSVFSAVASLGIICTLLVCLTNN